MELIVVFIGFLSVVVILLVLSTLHYFLGRTSDTPTAERATSQNRRKNARKKQRRAQRQQSLEDEDELIDDDDDGDFQDTLNFETPVEDEQRTKNNEVPLKPQASVAPVKQTAEKKEPPPPPPPRVRSEKKSDGSTTQNSKKKSKKSTNVVVDAPSSRQKKDTQSASTEPRESASITNDYSSESDFIPESSPIVRHSFPSKPVVVDARRKQLEELISILDSNAFTGDQLEILLNRVTNRTRVNSNLLNELFPSRKNEEILQSLFDEKNRNHLKTLAIELQSEKNRFLELSKTNGELEQMLRQLQHEQQTPNEPLIHCQQALGSYQMQIKRVTDENNQLMHQLHAYSMIPASINELKQQQQIVDEQIRQMSLRNSILEKEIADGERASKNAADIYRKADAQKQDRIEQMLADLTKYKKIDREIVAYRQKNEDLEKNFQPKCNELRRECEELEERLAQLTDLSTSKTVEEEQWENELLEAQKKNKLLKQRHCKLIEQLTKLTEERKSAESS